MEQILHVKDITKKYADKTVVSSISFDIMKGDIIGFIGPNGAGKSTTIHMLTTMITPNEGDIYFHNKSITNDLNTYKNALGIVPQEIAIYEDLSAYDNVKFFCSLYGFRGNDLKEKVKEALSFVGLWEHKKDLPSKFSGGMKRRLNIACAIAHKPELLIMDEPTVGIDPQSRNHIMEAIKQLNKQGTTILYTSHYMEEIDNLCNRIILLDKGRIVEDATKEVYKETYQKMGYTSFEDIFLYATGSDLRDMED